MTDVRPAKKTRWSRGRIRLLAWVSGSAAFVAIAGIVGISPKPTASNDVVASAGRPRAVQQKVIIRRIVRRIVIVDAPKPTYSSGSSSSTPTYSSSSGSNGTTASAPAAPPPMSTGGSAP